MTAAVGPVPDTNMARINRAATYQMIQCQPARHTDGARQQDRFFLIIRRQRTRPRSFEDQIASERTKLEKRARDWSPGRRMLDSTSDLQVTRREVWGLLLARSGRSAHWPFQPSAQFKFESGVSLFIESNQY